MTSVNPILIAGPTASGKSALALLLAEATGGTVINADSMQVYRELRIISARPSEADENRVPHALYGHVSAREAYSAGRYAREAAIAIQEAKRSGRRPVIVGGTGLYFKALLEGLSPIPPVDPAVRDIWRARALERTPEDLYQELKRRDPGMAERLSPTDPQRITRALEVLESTGQSLSVWQQRPGEPVLDADSSIRLLLMPSRETLYQRCDTRFLAMLNTGARAEVEALAALNLDPGLPAMRALGVPQILKMVRGEMSDDEAILEAQQQTRQYAKRQLTWLRRNMNSWKAVQTQETESNTKDLLQNILNDC